MRFKGVKVVEYTESMYKALGLVGVVVMVMVGTWIFSEEVRRYCEERFPGVDRFGESPLHDLSAIDPSYLLISPLTANAKADNEPGEVILTNLLGEVIHRWQTPRRIYTAQLMPNGTLLTAQVAPGGNDQAPAGGRTGILEAYDKTGMVVWSYRNDALHHDFEILPNGNILGIVWYPLPTTTAAAIPGGLPGTEFQGTVWADALVEIEFGTGREVWRWNSHDHLLPESFPMLPDQHRSLWTHLNSIDYQEIVGENPERRIAISFRNLSTVVVIDRDSGAVIFESPRGLFAGQHAPRFVDVDTLLVFDNGWKRKAAGRLDSALHSRVVMVSLPTAAIEWEFRAGDTGQERQHFYSQIMGNAELLGNGNILVADGVNGRFFELTPDRQVVWDMQNPFSSFSAGPWENRAFFTAQRYEEDFIQSHFETLGALPQVGLWCNYVRF
jgi:hypothetical protein